MALTTVAAWILIFLGSVVGYIMYRRMFQGEDDDEATFYALAKLAPYAIAPDKVYRHPTLLMLPHLGRQMVVETLPKYFKWREKLLVPVRSQGRCASCWAFAIADMVADRVSLQTGGRIRECLSVQEMLACFSPAAFPCHVGGIPEIAIYYPMKMGLVTEEAYPYAQFLERDIGQCTVSDRLGLMSYLLSDANRHEKYPSRTFVQDGSNRNLCVVPRNAKVLAENIRNMKTEIFLHGPIVGTVTVYDDLYHYDAESVYTVTPGSRLRGGHAIEIFGWCDEGQNTEEAGFQGAYWICRNSWGQQWPKRVGDNYGWFYVRMGTNEAGIEERSSAADPMLTKEMQRMNTLPGSSRDATSYSSYSAYVNDPERTNFFQHLQTRRRTQQLP